MKKILLTILILPIVALAQDGGSVTIGERTVPYEVAEQGDGASYYYFEGSLVASEHGAVSFVYENDQAVLEAHDTDGDGALDAFIVLDDEARLVEVTGSRADKFTEGEPVEFADLVAERGGSSATADGANEDLVGPVDRITIPKHGGFPWLTVVIVLLIAGGGYRYYKKRKMAEAEL